MISLYVQVYGHNDDLDYEYIEPLQRVNTKWKILDLYDITGRVGDYKNVKATYCDSPYSDVLLAIL